MDEVLLRPGMHLLGFAKSSTIASQEPFERWHWASLQLRSPAAWLYGCVVLRLLFFGQNDHHFGGPLKKDTPNINLYNEPKVKRFWSLLLRWSSAWVFKEQTIVEPQQLVLDIRPVS